jgi:hypothetical protein
MTGGEALYLAMAVAAFVVFALALGWISETEQRKQRRGKKPPVITAPQLPLRKAA